MKHSIMLGVTFIAILLSMAYFGLGGCTRNGKLLVTSERKTRETEQIVIPVNNCSGASEITSEATYDLHINLQGAADLGVDVGTVKATVGSSLGVESGTTIKHTVRTPACMQGEHKIQFIIDITEGFVTDSRSGERASFVLTVPQSVAGVESNLIDCGCQSENDNGEALESPKDHAWRCTVEFTDRNTSGVVGNGELTFGKVINGNEVDYGRLFLDTVNMRGMGRNMESEAVAWGFMGVRTDDTLTFVFPDYRFPGQPIILVNATANHADNTLELRGDLMMNKDDAGTTAVVKASCRVAD